VERARYTKLIEDDSWGVWVNGQPTPEPGDIVPVTKTDGTVKPEIIESIIWQDEERALAESAATRCL